MAILFISDLHLTPDAPDTTECFIQFMREEAIHADALYVLGDLFEFWIGDDDRSEFATQIKHEFQQLTGLGIPCYFIQGNRDFLLGKRFAKQTGIQILQQETVVDLYGKKAVILHGDTLCTRDINYLKFRQKVHQPWLQWIFNRLPFTWKEKIVSKVQSDIKNDKRDKSLDIMDVTASEVEKVMDQHDVDLMIHGHTHRPNVHRINSTKGEKTRVVLGDWYTQGSVLVYDKTGYELQTRPFSSKSSH
ncbi:UDP-2,3-diacylglucosamine diphosphatase [Vibrio sp. S4M6]|uniref:UDP-2,3-diacylglucosamine diphosphatase n=1 Tax=Vibrio sinus TaxID=2946865 RepID=UPI00202A6C38|nr:UDP-2,3-diacylglucosamine diphosphatase [Vibrio sinus]MCL9782663.1 UDP-2,3-diacylglucosamine diphosphatase [Vibrio sinus]